MLEVASRVFTMSKSANILQMIYVDDIFIAILCIILGFLVG